MTKYLLAALAAIGAVSVQAQPLQEPVSIRPNVDTAEELRTMRNLTACLAKARPRWARKTLSHPYLSNAQEHDAALALRGTDTCVTRHETEVMFRTSGLVANLAEHFLRSDIKQVDSTRLARALATVAPLNVSEDFALCVAARHPTAARNLALSEPGTAAETEAADLLATHVPPCVKPGETPTIDLQSFRALMATALYRGVTTVLASRN